MVGPGSGLSRFWPNWLRIKVDMAWCFGVKIRSTLVCSDGFMFFAGLSV